MADPRIASHNTLCLFWAGDKIASVTPAPSHEARKQNFSVSKIAIITDKVEENLRVLQSKQCVNA